MKAICPVCQRRVGVRVPKGGDGSAVRPFRHNSPSGGTCDGAYKTLDASEVIDE